MKAPAATGFEISPWTWAALPPSILIAQYFLRWVDLDFYRRFVEPELGLIELATPALLLPAIFAAFVLFKRRAELPRRWLGPWFLACGLGALYFAGEELSWGQHLFDWDTPELFMRLNDQNETNLHNMTSWLDQKPRALVKALVLFGGIIAPLFMRPPGGWATSNPRCWLLPSPICAPTAILAIGLSVPAYFSKHFAVAIPHPFDIRESETIELLYALFFLLYLVSAKRRLKALRAAQ